MGGRGVDLSVGRVGLWGGRRGVLVAGRLVPGRAHIRHNTVVAAGLAQPALEGGGG